MADDNPIYTPPFSKAEYDRRLAETKKRMADAGVDLMVCRGRIVRSAMRRSGGRHVEKSRPVVIKSGPPDILMNRCEIC